jgi:hypothetical protein
MSILYAKLVISPSGNYACNYKYGCKTEAKKEEGI